MSESWLFFFFWYRFLHIHFCTPRILFATLLTILSFKLSIWWNHIPHPASSATFPICGWCYPLPISRVEMLSTRPGESLGFSLVVFIPSRTWVFIPKWSWICLLCLLFGFPCHLPSTVFRCVTPTFASGSTVMLRGPPPPPYCLPGSVCFTGLHLGSSSTSVCCWASHLRLPLGSRWLDIMRCLMWGCTLCLLVSFSLAGWHQGGVSSTRRHFLLSRPHSSPFPQSFPFAVNFCHILSGLR